MATLALPQICALTRFDNSVPHLASASRTLPDEDDPGASGSHGPGSLSVSMVMTFVMRGLTSAPRSARRATLAWHGPRKPPREINVVTEIVIGVAVLALLIYRQLRTRPVNGLRVVAIIGVIGLIETYQFLQQHRAR